MSTDDLFDNSQKQQYMLYLPYNIQTIPSN